MNKMLFEDAYVLSAYVGEDQKQENGKWINAGTKSLRLTLLVDSVEGKLGTGSVKFLTTVNNTKCDVDKVCAALKRFDKINLGAYVNEFGTKTSYKVYELIKDGVNLMAMNAVLAETNELLPF